jgi:predicted NAD-dependent protein-ADP-ribosyltransferase YbiA (DUF1768 family)
VKAKVMEKILRDKFRRNKDLRERLATTESREIINMITDGDNSESNLFWGLVGNKG